MDSAAAHLSSPSPSDSHGLHAVVTPRLLTVVAHYTLTEAGRKASLLAGGDGRAQQLLELQPPTTRLHGDGGRAGLGAAEAVAAL
jgi:hypothetical protein